MQTSPAMTILGQRGLMMPIWAHTSTLAYHRLQACLLCLQAAVAHAQAPNAPQPNLDAVLQRTQWAQTDWLLELARGTSALVAGSQPAWLIPDLEQLTAALSAELVNLARPVLESSTTDAEPHWRVQRWQGWLEDLHGDELSQLQYEQLCADIDDLDDGDSGHNLQPLRERAKRRLDMRLSSPGTQAERSGSASLVHLMQDLRLAVDGIEMQLGCERMHGAHVWRVDHDDLAWVEAYMRGLARTQALRFDHPGLETVATRQSGQLFIQSDIGSHDANTLILAVDGHDITLTYADLHRTRFAFFQALLGPWGALWSDMASKVAPDLSEGQASTLGLARFSCEDRVRLTRTLEAIGASVVYLLDWERARKRLLNFVDGEGATAVLLAAAQAEVGHKAWLRLGADRLVFSAMHALGAQAFRIGDRLDEVLGAEGAKAFMLEVLRRCKHTLDEGLRTRLLDDEVRLMLARQLQHRADQFDLVDEHAVYCKRLSDGICDAIDGLSPHATRSAQCAGRDEATRAKAWARRAKQAVGVALAEAQRMPRWQPIAQLLVLADQAVDALEEAAFLVGLGYDQPQEPGAAAALVALSELAQGVRQACSEHLELCTQARSDGAAPAREHGPSRVAVLRSHALSQLRQFQRGALLAPNPGTGLNLATEIAAALQRATDHLLQTRLELWALLPVSDETSA